MSKFSKEQIQVLAESLKSPFGTVRLMCDGYRVTLAVEHSGMKLFVMIYINGAFKGVWTNPVHAHPENKFMRCVTTPVYSKKYIGDMEKILGKRRVAADPKYKETRTMYYPYWTSGKAALNHLNRVCDSLEKDES